MVPIKEAVVMIASSANPVPAASEHFTEETDVQEDVPHEVDPILTDGVMSG